MSSFFDTNNKSDCNGCGVCALKCPKKAIVMETDSEGFLYPVIDKTKCVNCNICRRVCPNKEFDINKNVKTYIAINKDKKELFNSSSGGCFMPIARYILSKKGVVFGATYNHNLIVKHDFVENIEDLKKIQGSKYVRSDLNNSYTKIKEYLEQDRFVLFTGTPCQCQGLRTYLGKEYEKLLICEIICHANPSPKVYELYKAGLSKRKNKKIEKIEFRSKKNGWHDSSTFITYKNGICESDKTFYNGFIKELYNRPSCHNCRFSSSNRLADFTIGDAWGIEELDDSIKDDNTGISLLCINTPKGESLLGFLNNELTLKQVDTKSAFSKNHNINVDPHKKREEFFEKIEKGIINETNILSSIDKYTRTPIYKKIINKIKKLIRK